MCAVTPEEEEEDMTEAVNFTKHW